MDDVVALVRSAWDYRQDRERSEHKDVMTALEHRWTQLTEEERGCAANYLIWAVLDSAAKNDQFKIQTFGNGDGCPIPRRVVDEQEFSEEIGWIRRLTEHCRFSSKLDEWFTRKRHAFVDEFRGDPELISGVEKWPAMTARQRRGFLVGVVRRRIESFSDKTFSFAMPEIKISVEEGGCRGSASPQENTITLNKAIFLEDDPSEALTTVYHEGTHNILTQLAMAAWAGQIEESNPLYDDIQKASFTRYYGLSPPGQLASLYEADDEERLAYQEADYFGFNLRNGYGLRAKFDMARRNITHRQSDIGKTRLRDLLDALRLG
jgi:hypothetical protein